MPDAVFRMVRLQIDAKRLVSFAGKGLPPGHDDLAFVAHRILSSLFGEGTIQPFRVVDDQARQVVIVGYTADGADALRQHADEFADPLAHAAVDWDAFAAKDMPYAWPPGRRLGFEIRLCPVVRLASARTLDWKSESRSLPAGAELDAFVHARHLRGEENATRESVYGAWLRDRVSGAAELHDVSMRAFRRLRLVRLSHESKRRTRRLERPDAIMTGALIVNDPVPFHDLLARGIGRHRAYGFGMLLLRPGS